MIQEHIFFFLAAFWGGGSGSVKEIALRQANDHIEKLEKKNRIMKEEIEKSRKDADDCHKSASIWKTRFMKLRTETDKCSACKPFAAAIIGK